MIPDRPGEAFMLLGGRVALRQPERGYRVAIDPVLLAAAISAGDGARILDVGCGVGAASLCLASRVAGCAVEGIDLDPDAIAMARDNASANGCHDRVAFTRADVGAGIPEGFAGRFDHVMSNPPYLPPGRADLRLLGEASRRASVESVPLGKWIAVMAGCAAQGASLTVIHRADRLEAVLEAFAAVAGGLTVVPLWPRAGVSAKRILVSGIKGSRAPTILAPGLVLHTDGGAFTPAAKEILMAGGPMLPLDAGNVTAEQER